MDGERPAHNEVLAPGSRPQPDHLLRCGWCGLLPLPVDRTLIEGHQLCSVCFDILKGADWRTLLNEAASRREMSTGSEEPR